MNNCSIEQLYYWIIVLLNNCTKRFQIAHITKQSKITTYKASEDRGKRILVCPYLSVWPNMGIRDAHLFRTPIMVKSWIFFDIPHDSYTPGTRWECQKASIVIIFQDIWHLTINGRFFTMRLHSYLQIHFLLIRSKFTFQHNLGPQRSWKQKSQIWNRLVEAHNVEAHNVETNNVEVMIT